MSNDPAYATMKNPAAFISYARRDDAAYGGRITGLRQRLQGLVASAIGRDFEIFQDRQGIAWGEHWPTRLDEALEEALFLIPILTPSYFNSEACRAELETFLELERRSGRKDRILSLYFLDAPVYERKADELAVILSERQHRDWRHLRNDPLGTAKVRRALDRLAGELAAAIHARQGAASPPPTVRDAVGQTSVRETAPRAIRGRESTAPPPTSGRTRIETPPEHLEPFSQRSVRRHRIPVLITPSNTDTFLSQPIDFDNLADYTLWKYPGLPVDERVQNILLRDLAGTHFVTLRDVDKAVEAATAAVECYRKENPEVFMAGTDFITKSIGFVDKQFRAKHGFYRPTREAFQRFEHLVWEEGRVFRDIEAPWCPELVAIPAGSFVMGSPETEEGRSRDEGPQHEVRFAQPFALGKYPVTFAEYDHFCADTQRKEPTDQGWGRGRRPAINVSWTDAQGYCAWLRRQTGQPYRLPSEAEWEYACRAGTTTPFWTGETISTEQANYDGNYTYGPGRKGECREKTTPVDTFEANPWGLHDMHGNVWEWCEDCWNDDYRGAPNNGSAWLRGNCSLRVERGGSWRYSPEGLRSGGRDRDGPDVQDLYIGFRVARTLTP